MRRLAGSSRGGIGRRYGCHVGDILHCKRGYRPTRSRAGDELHISYSGPAVVTVTQRPTTHYPLLTTHYPVVKWVAGSSWTAAVNLSF